MGCYKPKIKNIEEKANLLFLYLKNKTDYVSKNEIGCYLGIENERTVREVISLLASKKPIISNSKIKGYKLAKSKDDLEEVEQTWAELSSRMEELEKRVAPLIKFREKYKFNT